MTRRRYQRIIAAAAALLACCLLLSLWIATRPGDDTAADRTSFTQAEPGQSASPSRLSVAAPLAACEARIARERRRAPTVAIVGASYTAGTGPGNPALSWAVDVARLLHWNAVIYGVPGAGYVSAGDQRRGPMARMLMKERLRALRPALVLVQAGHDDVGVPGPVEASRVHATVDLIRASAPSARIALLTTFGVTRTGSPALRRTDRAIVAAGTTAARGVIIMDPLAGRWAFPRAGGGLHPTAAGDAWIARTVEAMLADHGVRAAPSSPTIICDESVGVQRPSGTTA